MRILRTVPPHHDFFDDDDKNVLTFVFIVKT